MGLRQSLVNFERLHQDSGAWRLLRGSNSWWTIAFLQDLFEVDREQDISKAVVSLDTLLQDLRAGGRITETDIFAKDYIRDWINKGWLREDDQRITPTDPLETAIRFVASMDGGSRDSGASASHLAIVQTMATNLAVELSPDRQQRMTLLKSEIEKLERKVTDLEAGLMEPLSPARHREQARNLFRQAMLLTRDFALIQDGMVVMDRQMRRRIVEEGGGRGVAVRARLEGEQVLMESEAGQAFDGFYQLLMDDVSTSEFIEKLRTICERSGDDILSAEMKHALIRLPRQLSGESQRVFKKRRIINQNFQSFLESGAGSDKQRMDVLFEEISATTMALVDAGIRGTVDVGYIIRTGKAERFSPLTARAQGPDSIIDTSNFVVADTDITITPEMASQLRGINPTKIARRIAVTVEEKGAMSISDLAREHPVERGLEELLSYIQVALRYQAPQLGGLDTVYFSNSDKQYRGLLPKFIFTRELFPSDPQEIRI